MIQLMGSNDDLYQWEYEIEDNDIVQFYKKEKIGDQDKKANNGSAMEQYYFKALAPGKTKIKFIFRNAKNGSYDKIKYYDITVDKNLKLSIKKNKI